MAKNRMSPVGGQKAVNPVFVVLIVSLLPCAIVCQYESELQDLENTPFILFSGVAYRDRLTVGASQAVAQFASSFQPSEKQKIFQTRLQAQRVGSNKPQSPQFYSHTLKQTIGSNDLNTLEFEQSRRIRIPEDLRQDRILADRDEAIILAERDADDASNAVNSYSSASQTTTSLGLVRPKTKALRPYGGNYQTVVGHGLAYSTNGNAYQDPVYPAGTYSTFASPTVASNTGVAYSGLDFSPSQSGALYGNSAAKSILVPGRPTVDYNIQVAHGTNGGSYSYTTFG